MLNNDSRDSATGAQEGVPLLPPEDRRRVIAEEEFRRHVARRVDRELTPRGERWLRQLSTPVVIWFLSSVVLAVVGWGYKKYETRQQSRVQQEEAGVFRTAELYYRLSACDELDSVPNRHNIEALLNAVIGLRPLKLEYKDVSLAAVYVQSCFWKGPCTLAPDSVLKAAERIRLLLWPEILERGVHAKFTNYAIVPELRRQCSKFQPIRREFRTLLVAKRD
jgi:hypothetical protein